MTFPYILCQFVRMSRSESTWPAVQVVIGVVNKTQRLLRSWGLPNDSKHNEVSFSTISTDMS